MQLRYILIYIVIYLDIIVLSKCCNVNAVALIALIICLFIVVFKLCDRYLIKGHSRHVLSDYAGLKLNELLSVGKYQSIKSPDVTFEIFQFQKGSLLDQHLKSNQDFLSTHIGPAFEDHNEMFQHRIRKLFEFNAEKSKGEAWHSKVTDFMLNIFFRPFIFQNESLRRAIRSASIVELESLINTMESKQMHFNQVGYDSDRFEHAFIAVAFKKDFHQIDQIEMSLSVHPDRAYRGTGTPNEFQYHMFIQRDFQHLMHQWFLGRETTPKLSLQLHCAAAMALDAEFVVSKPLSKMKQILSDTGYYEEAELREDIGEINWNYFGQVQSSFSQPPNFRSKKGFVSNVCVPKLKLISGNHGLYQKNYESGCQCLIL